MAVIGISYTGQKEKIKYKHVRIAYNNLANEKIFNSGDFVKDWYLHNKFILQELFDTEHAFSNSSSVDHFIMDGAPYNSAYLCVKDDTPYLSYTYSEGGIEYFVKKDTTPTWEELRKICDDIKK